MTPMVASGMATRRARAAPTKPHAKATSELDWHPRPLAEGLPETVAWLRGEGAR